MGSGKDDMRLGMWVVVGGMVVVWGVVCGVVLIGAATSLNLTAITEGLGIMRARGAGLIVQTIGIAGGIALLSLVLGIPMARVLMGSQKRWVWALALVPMWMPSYAVYGAMNLARAPDTLVGSWLIELSTSSEGNRWMTIWSGYAIGVLGMALWGSVVAAIVIAGSAMHRDQYDDMMDLEPARIWTRARVWIGLHRGALMRAWGLVGVVMLGSGVPLHLAQLETWSIIVWRELAQRGSDEWGVVWVLGSPMVLVGVLGAWWLSRVVVRDPTSCAMVGTGVEQRSRHTGGLVLASIVWSCAVVLPMVVLSVSIDDWRSMGLFWSERGNAIGHSVWIGLVVGLIAAAYAIGVACLLGDAKKWVRVFGSLCVFGPAATALVPGVMVGASIAGTGWLSGGFGEVVGLLARVLVVSAVVGAVLAGRERGELLSQRWSIGGGFHVWWSTHGRGCLIASIGAGVLCGLLAIHEIEASVMITRAGVSTLSQGLLADLHYARLERLSAALLNIMILALFVSIIGGWLLSMSNQKNTDH